MCDISIIVPVYNTEKMLPRCLESILISDNENIEILVINDGSKGECDTIMEEYRKRYPGIIKYYSKQNTGIADTRNFGIERASGKYVMFVDSDDYIDKNLINVLSVYLTKNPDIVKFKLARVDENDNVLEKVNGPIFEQLNGEEAFVELCEKDVLIDSPCIYAFKKKMFTNKLKFKVGTEHEDFGLIPLLITKAKSVISIDFYGYYYVQSNNSLTRNDSYQKTIKKLEDTFMHYDNMIEFTNEEKISNLAKEKLKQYYTNSIILKLKEINKKDRKIYVKKIKNKKMISNIKVHNFKQLIKRMILNININLYLKMK